MGIGEAKNPGKRLTCQADQRDVPVLYKNVVP
jgi:hypothetical protein